MYVLLAAIHNESHAQRHTTIKERVPAIVCAVTTLVTELHCVSAIGIASPDHCWGGGGIVRVNTVI